MWLLDTSVCVLLIDRSDEQAFARLLVRAQLRREGRPIGGNDLMIAATVSGLEMESW